MIALRCAAGTLQVDGSVALDVMIDAAGTLAGIGTLGRCRQPRHQGWMGLV